jgi:hypothetical protein
LPTEPERLVVNTGRLIALGRVNSLDVIDPDFDQVRRAG